MRPGCHDLQGRDPTKGLGLGKSNKILNSLGLSYPEIPQKSEEVSWGQEGVEKSLEKDFFETCSRLSNFSCFFFKTLAVPGPETFSDFSGFFGPEGLTRDCCSSWVFANKPWKCYVEACQKSFPNKVYPLQLRETPGQLQGPKTPKLEIPRKKLKNYPPGPDPKFLEKNSKNTENTQKILKSGILSIF